MTCLNDTKKLLTIGGYFLVILFPFFLFLSIQTASQTILCPDSFYHAKITEFLTNGQLIKNFPWLPFTIFSRFYIDHHFLYHLLLIPFVKIWGGLTGIKIATAVFATLTIFIFYWFLKKFKIKFPLFWTFLLLTSSVFLTRINLAKVPAIALTVLLLSLYTLFKRKKVLLSIMAFVYVWLYNTWPILVIAVIIYCLASALKELINNWTILKNYFLKLIFYFFRKFFSPQNLSLLFWLLLGIVGGLILNPYFPENLSFDLIHIVKIGLKNYQNILPVGVEWYPYQPFKLVAENIFIILPWLIGLGWFIVSFSARGRSTLDGKKIENEKIFGQSLPSFTLFIFSFLFFIYTIKSRRNIDYFIPLAILSAAFSLNTLLSNLPWKKFFTELKFFKKNIHYTLITAVLIFLLSIILIFSISSILKNIWLAKKNEFSKGADFNKLKNVALFLKENSQPGEIIFHSSWDEFPALFYHNDYNRYIAGLDPTFSYEENKPLYWLWYNIVIGQQNKNIATTIKNKFKANLVVVKKNYTKLKENIEKNNNFELIYQDEEGYIYRIKK